MPLSLEQIINVASQARAATAILQAVGLEIPAPLLDFENKASQVLAVVGPPEVPHNLDDAMEEVGQITKAVFPLLRTTDLGSIVAAASAISATYHNLKTGQIAILGQIDSSYDGEADVTVIAAYRKSGVFAKLVNEGVIDANDVTA